jgi:hypothetical protein
MKNKLSLVTCVVFAALVMSGCDKPDASKQKLNQGDEMRIAENSTDTDGKAFLNVCVKEIISLPNYGDPGQRLQNCFVEYPAEPTRPDKSYYIVEDICGQFTQEFMENMYGGKLLRIEQPQVASANNCTYFFDEKEYVTLNLEYLSIENQKKGNEAMDRKMEKNTAISMENYVSIQEDGAINAIYFVLSPNKFLSFRPSSKKAIENEKIIDFAANIAGEIKSYK